jgi:hypothetical protein
LLPSHTNLLTLSNTQAKDLAGRFVTIGTEAYYFRNYDPEHPGQPPWRSGAEGKAYPLLGYDRSVAAYLKFFTRPTPKRFERTAWLIGRQMHTWLPHLAAAPLAWVDTRSAGQAAEGVRDFAGYLARAVPGQTWLELKNAIHDNSVSFPEGLRWRCVRDLVAALAVLEQEDIVHGDLSPNNIVIDVEARPDQPALYLIDFDAFVTPAAGPNRAVTVAEGGTYGTDGYCPPDLAVRAMAGDGDVAPYSDRFGRDMLLVELLMMDRGLSPDDPPSLWDRDHFQRRHAAWAARSDEACLRTLEHLGPATVVALAEQDRPASAELAAGLGLSAAPERQPRPVTQLCRTVPAVLGARPAVADLHRLYRRPAPPKKGKPVVGHAPASGASDDQQPPSPRSPTLLEDLGPLLPPVVFVVIAAVLFGLAVLMQFLHGG